MAPTSKKAIVPTRPDSPYPQMNTHESTEAVFAVEALDVLPLAWAPSEEGPGSPQGRSVDRTRGRPTSPRPPTRSAGASRSLTPRREIRKIPGRSPTPTRPTTGQLALKGKAAAPVQAITISSGTSTGYTSSYTPSTPTVQKNRMGPGMGKGKVLMPPLTSDEKNEVRESLDSSSPSTIRRKMPPPPITGLPGQFEEERKTDMEKVFRVVSALREKNRALEETVSELKMAHLDMEDSFRHLRISTNAKLRRLARAVRHEDVLAPPSP